VLQIGQSCFTPFRCIHERSVPTPKPGHGQLLVKVEGSSVNPCDVDYIEFGVGCNGGAGTLGMDLAGTVVAVGGGCERRKLTGTYSCFDIQSLTGWLWVSQGGRRRLG